MCFSAGALGWTLQLHVRLVHNVNLESIVGGTQIKTLHLG